MQARDKMQNEDCSLGVKYRMKTTECRPGKNERKDSRKYVCAHRSLSKSIKNYLTWSKCLLFFSCSYGKVCLLIEE